ncbi:MAG: alpha/beta hydrolase [Chloroflexi bacterium]|nr:alpha/beta hydrolase [Chloroflexota bacterium]
MRHTRWPLVRSAASGVLLAALVIAIGVSVSRQVDLLDRHFIFFPTKGLTETPEAQGLQYEDVYFTATDGTRLNGWFVPGESDITWLWFHGNGGNLSGQVDELAATHRHLDVNIFVVDYRGYGNSEGKPSEKGLYLDADAAVEYLRSRGDVDMNRVVVFGRSLGSAVAVETARRHEVYALVLESPFTSIKEMAKLSYAFIPGWLFVKSRFDSLSKMAELRVPLLVLHDGGDELVPFDMGQEIFESATGHKRFALLENGAHNSAHLDSDTEYFKAIKDFLEGLPGQPSGQ